MNDSLSESEFNSDSSGRTVSEATCGVENSLQKSLEPSSREIERRRSIPPVVLRQIEQVSRMPGVPARDYYELFACFAEATEAKSVLEYLWVLDVTIATVEIQFYRRMKPLVIERFGQLHVRDLADRELAARQTLSEAGRRSHPHLFTEDQRQSVQRQYDASVDEAQAFLNSIDSLSHIDELIDAANRRRNAALLDIERRQAKFAGKLRVVSGTVIDANATPKSES